MKLTLDTLHHYCTACGDCLLWNLGVNSTGYPQARLGQKQGQMVRRYVFTELMGRQIPRGHVVVATCDDRLCLEPSHLTTMKRGKVQERAYAKGKRIHALEYASRLAKAQEQGLATLGWERARYIRSQPAERTNTAIAAELGVSHKVVSNVRRGKSWRENYGISSVFALATSRRAA
jgi:hypothetical protein